MTIGPGAICFSCVHWKGSVCDAYPNGIPDDIMFGGDDHRVPRGDEAEDDDGEPVLWRLAEGREAKFSAWEELVRP